MITKTAFFALLNNKDNKINVTAHVAVIVNTNGTQDLIIKQTSAPNSFLSTHKASTTTNAAFAKYNKWLNEWLAAQTAAAEESVARIAAGEAAPRIAAGEAAPRDSIEAMVQIINASKGTGRGYADQFPAYSVMRVDADVMHISRDVAKTLTFATPRMTARHGKLYTMFSLYSVGMYAASYGGDEAAAIAREKANGGQLFFFTQHGSSITSHQRPHEFFLEIMPGQKIMFDGVLLEVRAAANNNLSLVEVN